MTNLIWASLFAIWALGSVCIVVGLWVLLHKLTYKAIDMWFGKERLRLALKLLREHEDRKRREAALGKVSHPTAEIGQEL